MWVSGWTAVILNLSCQLLEFSYNKSNSFVFYKTFICLWPAQTEVTDHHHLTSHIKQLLGHFCILQVITTGVYRLQVWFPTLVMRGWLQRRLCRPWCIQFCSGEGQCCRKRHFLVSVHHPHSKAAGALRHWPQLERWASHLYSKADKHSKHIQYHQLHSLTVSTVCSKKHRAKKKLTNIRSILMFNVNKSAVFIWIMIICVCFS